MKQIDIKKPKYIIPILILPFILGIGWLVKDMINSAPAEETTLVETEEVGVVLLLICQRGKSRNFWWRCAWGTHPFSSRTRWLRPKRPMVLYWRRYGRAGGCQIPMGV